MSDMTDADDLVHDFSHPLVAILLATESTKGAPLDEAETLAVRDDAVCIRVTRSVADAMAEQRGYADIDPERCWEQWQDIRAQFDE
jgi:hypothetical protein